MRARTSHGPLGRSQGGGRAAALTLALTLLVSAMAPAAALAGEPTSTTLTASANPILSGSSVTLTVRATSGAGSPDGLVVVNDEGVEVGRCTLAAGTCSIVAAGLGPGGHPLVASYAAQGAFDASASDPLILTVTGGVRSASVAATTVSSGATSLTVAAPTGTLAGDLLVASVAVTGGSGTTIGAVGWTRLAGSDTVSGTVLKHGLFWRVRAVGETAGTYPFTFSSAQRASATIVAVAGASGATPVSSALANPSSTSFGTPGLGLGATPILGLPLAFGAVAVGTSSVTVGGGYTRTASIASTGGGRASVLTTTIGAQAAPRVATSASGATMSIGTAAVSIGATVFVPFPVASSVTRIASSASTAAFGQGVTYSARVDPSSATGWVTFTADGSTTIGRCQLAAGACSAAPVTLPVGSHTVVAAYGGVDGSLRASTSSPYAVTVLPAATSLTVTSSRNPAEHGTTARLAITVGGGGATAPTGEVVVSEGAARVGSCTLGAGGACPADVQLPVGSHDLLVSYLGDASFQGSATVLTQVVVPASTTTSVALSPAGGPYGTSFGATVTVATADGVATGTVAISDGTTPLATCALGSGGTAGTCTAALGRLGVGSHSIVATYLGDPDHASSRATAPLTVTRATATVTVFGSPNAAAPGANVTVIASVTTGDGSPATGLVAISDGPTSIGSCQLSGTLPATCSVLAVGLAIGEHRMTASYAGDPLHESASASYVQTIGRYSSVTSVANSPTTTTYGATVTFTVGVTSGGGVPTGTVALSDGSTDAAYGRCDLSAGACTIRTSTIPGGTRTIVARYLGSASIAPSSASVSQVVNRATSATGLGIVAGRTYGETSTLTATVTPATATGTVAFSDGSTFIGSCTLGAGTCSAQIVLAAGSRSISARYLGDVNYLASASVATTVSVAQTATTTTVATSGDAGYGGGLVFTARISPSTATGTVTFAEGGTTLGTCTLTSASSGTCAWTATTLSIGSHTVAVRYGGDANHVASQTSTTVTIVKGSSSVLVTSTAPETGYGGNVIFMALVTPSLATGTITFWDDATQIGTCSLTSTSNGQCGMMIGTLAIGSHPITARYGGSTLLNASVSPVLTQLVWPAETTTTVVPSANPSTMGGGTLTVTVSPSTASGLVAIHDGALEVGSCWLVSGRCSYSLAGLTAGTHELTATYGGDAAYGQSSSAVLTQVVQMGFRAAAGGSNGAGATSVSVTVPAAVLEGDVVLVAVTVASSTVAITPPAGWSRLGTDLVWSGTGPLTQGLFARVATSSDIARAATFTLGATLKASASLIAIGGAVSVVPDTFAGQVNGSPVPQIYTPVLATSGVRGIAVIFGGMATGTTFISVGAGYTLASGGQAASSGGKASSQTSTGVAYGTPGSFPTVGTSQLNTSSSLGAMNIAHVVFLPEAPATP